MMPFPPSSIAIIGLSGRFPDAPDLPAFWRNLEQGVESLVTFSDQELLDAGLPADLLRHANYVKKGTLLENAEFFDAEFFGYNPREAEIIDPQQRVFLECAWEALETAGYAGDAVRASIGVYAGSSSSTYVFSNLLKNRSVFESTGVYQVMIANEKDYLATRVSYKLDLKGPSVTIQTACSTSLVAVQAACSALLSGECDIALAGGVSIAFPQKSGYLYTEGMIFSPDGHCRPFDAQGRGIRSGFGAGVVVLKRLDQALQDGDSIRAVIRGAATSNDGGAKMGYTTPCVEGQARAIAGALRIAQVHPESVTYIEAHGTGTPVGDPIEIAALNQVFRAFTQKRQFCAVGSVKGNIGHLDAAAGIAGLIKTVLALEHKQIPPTVHFREPNPEIDFQNSPFFVNACLSEWTSNGTPRRAGVSSFGIGGTNAHVILEEAPPKLESKTNWPSQLLLLSGKNAVALEAASTRVAAHLAANPSVPLAEACYTLQVGRRRFPHRRMLVCSTAEDAIQGLSGKDRHKLISTFEERVSRPVVFMFSGQGSQHTEMARGLYECQPVFRSALDECAELLQDEIACDLRELLYSSGALASSLGQTRFAQPALFAIEHSLARLWISWGVQPESMIGHSIGEYVAACLAGVFSLKDGLRLVAARGRFMQEMAPGAMLAVRLSADGLQPYLHAEPAISLAAINAPHLCSVAGPLPAIGALRSALETRGVECRPLHTSHAFHSSMMDDALGPYREHLGRCRLSPPKIPFISNVTGRWILPEQATDVSYWTRQLRQTVRFADGIKELASDPSRLFLEVGPGQALASLTRDCLGGTAAIKILASLPHAQESQKDTEHILSTVGKLWLGGVPIDWDSLHAGESLHRVPLPTYPLQPQKYLVTPEPTDAPVDSLPPAEDRKAKLDDWFYVPSWRRSLPFLDPASAESYGPWLIFLDETDLSRSVSGILTTQGERIVSVRSGTSFLRHTEREFTIDPSRAEDYEALLRRLGTEGFHPRSVLYLWSFGKPLPETGRTHFRSLWVLARALDEQSHSGPIDCVVVSSGLHAVAGSEPVDPEMALVFGVCKTIPHECSRIRCRSIDLVADQRVSETAQALVLEPGRPHPSQAIAYRGGYRWEQSFEPVRLPAKAPSPLRSRGVYLITGGMGGIGYTIAAHLAETVQARIALLGRSPLPVRALWPEWLQNHRSDEATSQKIREVERIEALGGEVLTIAADVGDACAMEEAIRQVRDQFGPIQGAIHAAGNVEAGLMRRKTQESADRVLAAKVKGTRTLDWLLRDEPLDFLMLCSSVVALSGAPGLFDYAAGNCFLDAFSSSRYKGGKATVISVNWDAWREVGMAHKTRQEGDPSNPAHRKLEELAIFPSEGAEAFQRVLASGLPQVAVIPRDLQRVFAHAENNFSSVASVTDSLPSSAATSPAAPAVHEGQSRRPRPDLGFAHVAAQSEVQYVMAEIWSELLGIRDIGIDDGFFELGGHSLLAISVLSRVRSRLGVHLSLRTIFDAPTIRSLSERVETLLWVTSRSSSPAQVTEQREEFEL